MERGDGTAARLARAGVTDREAEVLAAVGDRLRNREIADRFHVSVRTVESHIAALLRKLGAADRAGLVEIGVRLRAAGRPDPALAGPPLTGLIGRDGDASALATLLDAHRLVTLVGAGGVGKTRLALHVAGREAGRFADGARLADLAPVGPALVGDTLARALGVVPEPGWPLREVLREVAAQLDGLLVVDNCEHVVADAAEIVADLLTAGSRLRVLATSREPLGVPGEAVYPVRPLPVPDADAEAETVTSYDAVRLFLDRAAAAKPGFTLTEATAPAVAALCRRLDGLPLAIELAAALVRAFEPDELVAHLDERFQLLTTGARTASPRHRSLRAAIDWSYALLDDGERTLFDRLGVFPADFDLAAARAVGDAGPAVLTLLPRLVDRSLVTAAGGRFRLLETIRAYAAERLAADPAEPGAARRHAAHYLALAEQAGAGLRTRDQQAWLARLAIEQPNLRAALAYTMAAADPEAAWRWIAALHRFWDLTGQAREAREWIRRAGAAGDPPGTAATVAGLAAASYILQPSDSSAALRTAKRAVRLAAGLDDVSRARAARAVGIAAMWVEPHVVARALHEALAGFTEDHPWERAVTMLALAMTTGDLDEALTWGRSGVALFRGAGDDTYAANSLFVMAQRAIEAGIGDDEVHDWLTESRALADERGSEADRVHASVGLGALAWLRGDHDGAARLMEQALPTLRRLGDQRCAGRALCLLGRRAHEENRLDDAERLLTASVEAIVLAGHSVVLVRAVEALAAVYAAGGRQRDAAVLLGTVHADRESAARLSPAGQLDERLHRCLVRDLGAAAFDAAYAEGRLLDPARALGSR